MGFGGSGGGGGGTIGSATDVALNNPANNQVLQYDGTIGKWKNATSTASSGVSVNSQSGTTYTPVSGDAGLILETTGSAGVTITIPPNNSVVFAVGTTIGLRQYGTGQITVAPGAGVAIRSRGSVYKLSGQYAEAVLTKRATDEWILSGDLTA